MSKGPLVIVAIVVAVIAAIAGSMVYNELGTGQLDLSRSRLNLISRLHSGEAPDDQVMHNRFRNCHRQARRSRWRLSHPCSARPAILEPDESGKRGSPERLACRRDNLRTNSQPDRCNRPMSKLHKSDYDTRYWSTHHLLRPLRSRQRTLLLGGSTPSVFADDWLSAKRALVLTSSFGF